IFYAFNEFLRRFRVTQVDRRKLRTDAHKMNVRVVKARNNDASAGIDYPRFEAGQLFYLFIAPDRNDLVAVNRQSRNDTVFGIHRVYLGVDNDKVRIECLSGNDTRKRGKNYKKN